MARGADRIAPVKPICGLIALSLALLIGCGKKASEQQTDHPNVATSYHNIALVYKAKKDLPKAKEYWEKAYAIRLKKLGANHPETKNTKAKLDALKE